MAEFVSTHWSLVASAADAHQTADARESLEHLCRIYWPPLFSYVRRRVMSHEDAEDLTQAFFARLIDGE